MSENAMYLTGGAIISAILWDVGKVIYFRINNKKSVKNSIREEIQNNVDGLKEYKLEITDIDDGWESLTMLLISRGSYDSCVNSGHFILLDIKLQSKINDFYMGITSFNSQVQNLGVLQDQPIDNEKKRPNFVKKKMNYISKLTIPELIKDSNNILKLLDK